MTTSSVDESVVELAALDWLNELGYAIAHGPDIAPGEPESERDSFGDVVLVQRLRQAIDRLNPTNNDWLAVNQFTVIEGQHNRRPDIVVFVNGLPLAVIELNRRRRRDDLDVDGG